MSDRKVRFDTRRLAVAWLELADARPGADAGAVRVLRPFTVGLGEAAARSCVPATSAGAGARIPSGLRS